MEDKAHICSQRDSHNMFQDMAKGCMEWVAAMPPWHLGQCLLRSVGCYA